MTRQEMIQRQAKQFVKMRFPELHAADSPVYQLNLAAVVKFIEESQDDRFPYMPLMAANKLQFVVIDQFMKPDESLQKKYEDTVNEVFSKLPPSLIHTLVMALDKWLIDQGLIYPQSYIHETATNLIVGGVRTVDAMIERFEALHKDQLGDQWRELLLCEVAMSKMGQIFDLVKGWVERDVAQGIIKIDSANINGTVIAFIEPLMCDLNQLLNDGILDVALTRNKYVELRDYGYNFTSQGPIGMNSNNSVFSNYQIQPSYGQNPAFNFQLGQVMCTKVALEGIREIFEIQGITLPREQLHNLAEYAVKRQVRTRQELTQLMQEAAVQTHGVNYLAVLRDLYPKAELLLPPEMPERVNAKEVSLPGYQFERDDVFYVINREYGISPNGNPLQGAWVCRDYHTGNFIDHDRNRTNLAQRLNIKLEGKL